MPEPKGYDRKVFESENCFNPYTRWNTTGKTITAAPAEDADDESGFCLTMVCYWIKLALQHGIGGSSRVLDGRAILHISIVHSGYKRLPRTFSGAATDTAAERLVYKQSGLELVWQKKTDEATDALNLLTDQQSHFFELGLPRHSVGLALVPSAGKQFYFDPNYGLFEYDLNVDCLEDIFRHCRRQYRADTEEVEWSYLKLR